eukprot:Protomagalhaensia_sp_Gyna_25__3257@NODE_2960_length_799_cov_1_832895_g2475_i0_p3_GENE_NODE_2960_length_799_cov_1_832895_g2475_i0NODE_2960_length_799_cov_1_832895_g2475_i0_p3_ORF_typecomplete_len106_score0_20HRM/PF02793_22/0_41_NODE_2960_length_799_cov_1_832895_g2475_i0216533
MEWKAAISEVKQKEALVISCILPPCWNCILTRALNYAVTLGVSSADDLRILCTFCLQSWANYLVWDRHRRVNSEVYCSCVDDLNDTSRSLEKIRVICCRCLVAND